MIFQLEKLLKEKKISFIEHEKWFNKKLNNQNSIMYIFCIKKKFIGQVRFDKVKNKNFISYSVDKEYRRKGYGKEILKKAINKINKQIKFKEVYAKVMKNNIASIKILSHYLLNAIIKIILTSLKKE